MARPADELAPFRLREVEGLQSGEKKGAGAYGAVFEVAVRGVPCIAKRLHDILVNQRVSRQERTALQEKFRQECVLLSKLKHPNIVHFVGVYYGRAPGDLSLVMERLDTDLGEFLDTKPNIPLPLKLSILLDVSYGLLYLHTLSPKPIIHRDLTANNILLTSDMRGKIADLGVSKLIDVHSQAAATHTKAPGSWNYMPPEALKERAIYDVKLDVFSFGHLALYTATQNFPNVYEVTLTAAVIQSGEHQILKRMRAIDEMGDCHCLVPLVKQCLKDDPSECPTTPDLNTTLKGLCSRHPKSLIENLKAQVECMTMEISRLESRVGTQNKEMADLKEQIRKKDEDIAALKAQAQTYLEDFEHERKDREEAASKMEAERAQLDYQFHEYGSDRDREVQLYKSEAKKLQAEYDKLTEKFEAIQLELVKHKDLLEHMQAQQKETQAQLHENHQNHQSLRKERDALKAELHHLKTVEGDFSAAFKTEYDQREQLEKKYNALIDRCDFQFRENDQLRTILSQHNIPCPPRPEATPTPPPPRVPLSTAATDTPRTRIPPLQQYHHMSPQVYQQSEQGAYQQQKLHEAIKQKEQRRQQELALKRQQLHMQGYSDPQIKGYTPRSVRGRRRSPVGRGPGFLPWLF